jgi:GNAT superfamily N-acetyltransferase
MLAPMPPPADLLLSVEDRPAEADVEALPHALEAFNERHWPGHQPWHALGVFLRRDGRVVGGLAGETYAGWLFVRYLWLEEALRGAGHGRRLIEEAERRAAERGCHSAWLDTFSFQAPDFYARLGYAEFGRLDYPPRGERIFLRKRLAARTDRGDP